MGFREATPGLVISFTATLLLALVTFNVPMIKSLNFLSATYSDGTAAFGTMGYCMTLGGTSTCVGPKIGYEFDPNTIFGISNFDIPTVVTKYLTYVLVLHIAALVCSFLGMLLGALSHIRNFALLCFPSFFAYLASALTLGAFIIDLVIWFIAKGRINRVPGASATIGVCVWLTLAAWILTMLSGCFYTCGRCCISNRRREQEKARDRDNYQNVPSTGYSPGKRVGPPIKEQEVSVPLTSANAEEDKYLEEEVPSGVPYASGPGANNGVGRHASVLPGVGYGYGRRADGQGASQDPYDRGYGNNTSNHAGYPPYAGAGGGDPNAAYNLAPGQPDYRMGSPATTAGSHVGVGVHRAGAVPGAPGYVPAERSAGGMAGMGAGMTAGAAVGAAAYTAGGGYGPSHHQGADVTDAYDPYNQHDYNQRDHNQQQAGYGQDNYGQTYPPRTPVSPSANRAMSPPQVRSPTGYDSYNPPAQQAYGMSYAHPAPAAPVNRTYGGASSPPLHSPPRHSWSQAGQVQDAYGGYDNGTTAMPQPLPAPTPHRVISAVPQDTFATDATYSGQQGGAGHYGGYGDQAHPTSDEDVRGPRPPSYDSAAGAGFGAHGQGSSTTAARQQRWQTAAEEKSGPL